MVCWYDVSNACIRRAIERGRHMRLRVVHAFQLLLALAICGLTGCGNGSGGGSSAPLLQGDPAHRAAILAGYQSFSAGVAYPYNTLLMVAPKGSTLSTGKAALPANSLLSLGAAVAASRQATVNHAATRSTTLTYVAALNLYTPGNPVVSGDTWVLPFYTDSAGSKSAGNLTITLPAGSNGSTDYTSYPAKISINIALTAGNLPCNGSVLLTFTGNTGKNTMVGTLTLPKTPVTYNINLALDDALNVSGSIVGTENGATVSLTNCS